MKKRLTLLILAVLPLLSMAQNNALTFDGANVYAYSNSAVNLSGSAITLEAWVYVTAFQANYPYISNLVGIGNQVYLRLGDYNIPAGNKVQFVINFGGTESKLTSAAVLKTGHWYHITGTYDGLHMNLFINGFFDSSIYQSGSFTANAKINLGVQYNNGTPARYFYGKLDEVRIWTRDRLQGEVKNDMYREIGQNTSLKAYYKLNEAGTTTSLTDASGNSHTATAVGISTGKWVPSRAFIGAKECLNFHDTNDYGSASRATSVIDNFTMSAWFNPSAIPTTGFSAVVYNGTDAGGYGFGIDSSGKLVALFGAVQWISTPQTISTGQWYYVTLRRTNGLTEVLVDGKVLSGVTYGISSTTAPKTPVSNYTVGNMFQSDGTTLYGNSFNGYIDEARVYDIALTNKQIRETMNKTLLGIGTNLVTYYRFNKTSGSVITPFIDASKTPNNLFLQNMTNADWVTSTAFNTWLNTGDAANTSWNNAANWSLGQVPTSSDNIGIPSYTAGNNPNDNVFNINVNTFVVEPGATLTLDGSFLTTNANAFNYGTITGTGSITSNSLFTNSGTINVNTFLVSSGASATTEAGKQMTLSTLTNNGTFTINSDASSSGSLIVTGTATGNVTYNRYLTSGTSSKWHMIAAPVGGQSINTFATTSSNNIATSGVNYSVTPYDNTVAKGATGTWAHWTSDGTGAGNFTSGKGYEILTTADGTVAFTGTVPTAQVSIGITKPTSNNGWNLIGNPFPSSIPANSNANTTNNFITVNAS